MYIETARNIAVEVYPEYLEEQSESDVPLCLYKYTVKITNESSHDIQLVDREWIITPSPIHPRIQTQFCSF